MSIACRREGGHMIKIDSADLMHDLVNILKNNGKLLFICVDYFSGMMNGSVKRDMNNDNGIDVVDDDDRREYRHG